jgi:hypothetical protein
VDGVNLVEADVVGDTDEDTTVLVEMPSLILFAAKPFQRNRLNRTQRDITVKFSTSLPCLNPNISARAIPMNGTIQLFCPIQICMRNVCELRKTGRYSAIQQSKTNLINPNRD